MCVRNVACHLTLCLQSTPRAAVFSTGWCGCYSPDGSARCLKTGVSRIIASKQRNRHRRGGMYNIIRLRAARADAIVLSSLHCIWLPARVSFLLPFSATSLVQCTKA